MNDISELSCRVSLALPEPDLSRMKQRTTLECTKMHQDGMLKQADPGG